MVQAANFLSLNRKSNQGIKSCSSYKQVMTKVMYLINPATLNVLEFEFFSLETLD